MKILSSENISKWLSNVGQIEDPHYAHEDDQPRFHIQFYAPKQHREIEFFVRRFLNEIVIEGDLLFQFIDWSPYDESVAFIIETVWDAIGNTRQIKEAPGCSFPWEERERAIALFSIATSFGWQCYIYSTQHQLILFNWEGEIFDAWTCSPEKLDQIRQLIGHLEFPIVPKGASQS